ncbi:MAG: AI-2E family transporter [Asticcacaulis sp.]|nr:AI-2E family transporter [Asticcacaulis sp.]
MAVRPDPSHEPLSIGFMQRVLFVVLATGLAFLALKLLGLWLLVFGAIVIAVILRGLAEPLMRFAKLKDKPAVAIALIGLIALVAVTVVLFGNQLSVQIDALSREIPQAWAAIHARLDTLPIGKALQGNIDDLGKQAGSLVSFLPGLAGNFLTAAANTFVALIAGVILAGAPGKYRDGVVSLFPKAMRPAILDSMNTSGEALRKWFIGPWRWAWSPVWRNWCRWSARPCRRGWACSWPVPAACSRCCGRWPFIRPCRSSRPIS